MRYLFLILIGFFLFPVHAMTKVDVYKTEVSIDSDAVPVEQARAEGFKQVLIKISGDPQIADNPYVQKALNDSEQYLTQFGYVDQDGRKVLRMEFNAALIRALLQQGHLSLWPAQRAQLLVWLIEDKDYQRTIHWENMDSSSIAQVKQMAEKRGLPVIIPVGDFQDITSVEASDLWAGFVEPTSLASQRYTPDAVLIIRDEGTMANWMLFDQSAQAMLNKPIAPQVGRASGPERLSQIINTMAQYYADKNRLVLGDDMASSILVQVDNLTTPSSYFMAENTLKAMNSVSSANVVKVGDLYAIFQLDLVATAQEFESEAQESQTLILDISEPETEAAMPTHSVIDESEDQPVASSTATESSTEEAISESLPVSDDASSTADSISSEVITTPEMVIRQSIPVNPDFVFHWQEVTPQATQEPVTEEEGEGASVDDVVSSEPSTSANESSVEVSP